MWSPDLLLLVIMGGERVLHTLKLPQLLLIMMEFDEEERESHSIKETHARLLEA